MVDVFVTYWELTKYGVPHYTRKHLLDMQRSGQFPKCVQLSPNRIAWRASALAEWVANRSEGIAASRPDKRHVVEAGDAAA